MSYDTEDFGTLSQKKIIGILKDVFGAEPPRHIDTTKKLIFNKNKFDRLDSVYNLELEIKVGRGLGEKNNVGLDKHMPPPPAAITAIHGSSASIADLDEIGSVGRDTTSEQPPSSSSDFESDESDESDVITAKTKDDATMSKDSSEISIEICKHSDNIPSKNEKPVKENEEIAGGSPPDGRIQATQATPIQQLQHQQTEMAVAIEPNNAAFPSNNIVNDKNQTAAIIVDVSKTIYRLGHSDMFACHNCKNKGDKWFMRVHDCSDKRLGGK
jgi:hypothetical protein